VIKAEQDLPGTEWGRGGEVGGGVQGGEMSQTMYARVNKKKIQLGWKKKHFVKSKVMIVKKKTKKNPSGS
jgi:hypothetical protein